MKNKFLILSLLVCSFFTACSSDDDGGNIDPIIGTWQKTAEVEDGVAIELSDCELQSTFTFTPNNEMSSISYDEYEGECFFDTNSSNWYNQGSNVYGIGESEEAIEDIIEFTFTNNNNTLSYEHEFQGVVTEYIYTRVE